MRKLSNLVALGVAALVLSACGGRPPLVAKSAVVPVGTDMTGQWQIIGDATADTRRPVSDDVLVDVFVRSANALRITQTEHGLFVSFDRSVVEEFRFGEERVVNVGQIEADRVSGWEDGAYVIETRDKENARLIEIWRLDGDTLTRTMTIVNGGVTEMERRQVFERT